MPSPIQFGTQPFSAAIGSRAEGIPEHATMIEGPLIHLDTKTLKGWGIRKAATKQIIDGIPGIPIRACNSSDPHACDLAYDDDSRVGYATKAWINGEWIMAAAAITDENAAKNIDDGTWTPFGKGGWSVIGFPAESSSEAFRKNGFMDGFRPAGVSLVLASTATPAYVGSGFEMVAAAISNYRGDNMPEDKDGDNPKTYTQEQFDAAVKDALKKQKTDDAAELKKAADAEIAKQKEASVEELAKMKADLETKFGKLSDDEKAAYEKKIADMTSKDDLKATLEAQAVQIKKDIADTQERTKLINEYKDIVQKSPVAGAPFMREGTFSDELFNAEVETLGGMVTAGIAGIVDKTKMVAAAVPGSDFNSLKYPSTPPGSATTEADLLADLNAMDGATGQVR